ncbi:hypothetical protein GCM10023340_33130 [Nocardioides marinquilinus]|uniref:DUF1440 domain-containing protein n=1 Tax=Nocardioides marinquilinus TaxID=1210400 RepID=A0ABP9PVI4_9ACTN
MTAAGTAATAGRALLAGAAGSAAMSATSRLERRLLPDSVDVVDYDASSHVVTAVAAVLRREPRDGGEHRAYFALAHWGYGSAIGLAYPVLRRRLGPGWAAPVALWAGCQTMALVLLPTLGDTPPPWRWRGRLLATSLAGHVVYVVGVAAATRALRRRSS